MFRRISLIILLIVALNSQEVSFFKNNAFAAQPGQSCKKAESTSGSLICTKVKTKLIWQLRKKQQTISTSSPSKVSITSQTISIDYSASSRLPVKAASTSPAICTIDGRTISLVTVGYCVIQLIQLGDSRFFSAKAKEFSILIQGSNQISFTPLSSLLLSSKIYLLAGTSTSGLSLKFESLTPDICSTLESTLALIKIGLCTVRASQSGSDFYVAAQNVEFNIFIQGSNQISFTPSNSLLLSTKTYLLSGTSTAGLTLRYESLTPDICSISESTLGLIKIGLCKVRASQNGSDFYVAAQPVEASIAVSGTRVTSDQTDVVTGFQIKAVYVIPFDGVDNSYDTNGYVSRILNEGNEYLYSQLKLRIPVDKTGVGYDIQFLKSKLPTSYFLTALDLTEKLLEESQSLETPGLNRKSYIFFIEVNGLMGGPACGYAPLHGMSAVVAIGAKCTGIYRNFKDLATLVWIHELTHNFGVEHTPGDPCDLMAGVPENSGTCSQNGVFTIDKGRAGYVGSSTQGQDILKLPVWEGYTGKDSGSRCFLNPVPRADGFKYAYCPTGTQTIGALKSCWNSINSVVLEEFIDGAWKSLGAGSHYSDPWGPTVEWKCRTGYTAPLKQLTITTPGMSLYRWMLNGSESEQFKVIWVR